MIKVCHMTCVHAPEDVRIFHKECVSLAKGGYEVYLVEMGESYDKYNVHIIGVGKASKNRIKRITADSKKVYERALNLNCDIYHLHDPELLRFALPLKKKGKTVVFDCHENTAAEIKDKTWIPVLLRAPICFAYNIYQRYVCSRIDAVIGVTPDLCEYFRSINSNVEMITNYPILKEFVSVEEKKRNSIVFAGGITEQWCHDKIIKAIDTLEKCQYILCGNATPSYLNILKKIYGWEKVTYMGSIKHEDVDQLLSSCEVGLAILKYSSNTYFKIGTLGNTKIFEEMMAGLPVVCTDFTLWENFINKYKCGICVNPENDKSIADAIKYLLENKEIAKEMGNNARKAVENEFNWNYEEAKLLKLYKNLISNY